LKRILLILVGLFEIISGCAGLFLVVGSLARRLAPEVAPLLWYGVFPVASVIAGVLLLLGWKYGFGLSVLVLVLQVPVIYMAVLTLNLGVALNSTTSAYWAPRNGESDMTLGVNLLALGVLVVLWLSRPKQAVFAPTAGVEQIVGPERPPARFSST
jgi:hypothetical protein